MRKTFVISLCFSAGVHLLIVGAKDRKYEEKEIQLVKSNAIKINLITILAKQKLQQPQIVKSEIGPSKPSLAGRKGKKSGAVSSKEPTTKNQKSKKNMNHERHRKTAVPKSYSQLFRKPGIADFSREELMGGGELTSITKRICRTSDANKNGTGKFRRQFIFAFGA